MSVPAAQLSCQQCQRRKTKCDKEIPTCSACLKAGIVCNKVQRHRLPRGRTSKKVLSGPALGDRIDRLEAIVSQLQHKLPASGQAAAVGIRSGVVAVTYRELTGLGSPTASSKINTARLLACQQR